MRVYTKVASLLCCIFPAAWGSPAIQLTPDPGNVFNNGNGYSLGYEFNLSQAVTVDSLGFFADPTLTESHTVGIFNSGGTLLVSATVLPGDPLTSDFRFHSITPFLLPAASGYVIAGVTGTTDPYTFDPTSFSTDPRVQFVQSEYDISSTLIFPTTTDGSTAYFGPNFDIMSSSSIPEPGSLLLIGAGLTILGFTRFRLKLRSR